MFLAALLQVGKAGTRGVERLGKSGVHHVQGIAASITQAVSLVASHEYLIAVE